MLQQIQRLLSLLPPGQWIDLACVALAVLLCILGGRRGISGQIARMLGLLGALVAGYWLYQPATQMLSAVKALHSRPELVGVAAFVLVFVVALMLFILLRISLQRFMHLIVEQPMDRILGVGVGLLQALLLCSFVFTVAILLPAGTVRKAFCEGSYVGSWLTPRLEATVQQQAENWQREHAAPGAKAGTKTGAKPAAKSAKPATKSKPPVKPAPKPAPTGGATRKPDEQPAQPATPRPRPGTNAAARPPARPH